MRYIDIINLMEAYSRDKTLTVYQSKIEQRIKSDHSANNSEMVITKLEQADPSMKKAFVLPLLQWYLSGSMRYLEDASKATSGLILYGKFKNRNLPPLNTLSFQQFLDLTDELSETKSSRELDKEEELQFYPDQAKIFYEDNEYKIVIPKTKEAAIYFGRRTRWCTSADNDNQFNYYNKKGRLYIIMFKGIDKKWQFHFGTNQFMDEQDEDLSRKDIMSTRLPEIFEKIAEKKMCLFLLRNPSEAVQLMAVKKDGNAIKFIDHPSENVKILAVKHNGNVIKYIKNPSEKVQLAAVKEDGNAIRFIDSPSEDVQLAAVQQNGWAIQHIDNPSEEVQLAAVKQNGNVIADIKNPSEAVQLAAVQQNGNAISYIDHPSEAVQLAAVQQDWWCIQHINDPSKSVQLAAVHQNADAISCINYPEDEVILLVKSMRKKSPRI